MAQTVYLISIHGSGRGFHEAMEALETIPHLAVASDYLVAGEAARDTLLAHHHEGKLKVIARHAHNADVPDEDATETDTAEIERFVEQVAGTTVQYDQAAGSWFLGDASGSAVTRREAALAALGHLLATHR